MNRRSVITLGLSALPVTVAGCVGNDPGGDESPEEIDLTARLPSPDLLGVDRYQFEYFDIATIDERRPDLVEPLGGVMELRNLFGLFYLAGLTFEDFDFLTRGVGARFDVAHGDFDVDALANELEANGFTRAGNGDDPTIYGIEGSRGNPAAIGVADSRVVTAGLGAINEEGDLAVGELARDPVEIVADLFTLDTEANDRYTSAAPAIASLVDRIDGGAIGRGQERRYHDTRVNSGRFEGRVANGVSWGFRDDGIEFTEVLVFDPDVTPPEDDIETWLGNELHFHTWGSSLQQTSGYEVTIDENLTIVEGRYEPQEAGWLA